MLFTDIKATGAMVQNGRGGGSISRLWLPDSSHDGLLGKTFSFVNINTPQIDIRAVKKSEDGGRSSSASKSFGA